MKSPTEGPTNIGPSSPVTHVIQTDYESSANEDDHSYTFSKYENAECALLSYSRTNKIDKLQALLEAKSRSEISLDLNYRGQQKKNFSWSALHLACYFGHLEVVKQFLGKKQFRDELDINIKNSSCDTPLHKATLTNRDQIVQLLLSNGANVFIKNCDDLLAKQLTSDKHIFEMLEAAEEADKNRIKLELFKAVDSGDFKMLQDYFSQNCDSLRNETENFSTSGLSTEGHQASSASGHTDHARDDVQDRTARDYPSAVLVNNMVDAHGNTLLHLAARRGFKAICVFLLEHGLDPYRQNNLGQTCIDLASYQLRQLFMTVKPANTQLKRMSSQQVTRLEGPLMKKVRILGCKQIYAILDNGVFLLFNNRRDSMNRSRRGYKYLESAICEPDPIELGMFTVTFSDRSRATFFISADLVVQYNSFKGLRTDANKQPTGSQVELVRQKWIDTIRDHIIYSTEFIRKGLNFNLDDEGEGIETSGDNIASLNHLLPMDTIKSFFQEARAHYNILERHAESMCSLVQSVAQQGGSAHSNSTFERSMRRAEAESLLQQNNSVTSSTTGGAGGSRLFGFIRGPRQAVAGVAASEDEHAQPSANAVNSTRARNENLTNEFIQDNWSCILFHLRLLMESAENTKTTMSQTLALMEHQEQLRQNRVQDQEERCRVLEDSLEALARDHHELEKSLSMSQLHDPAARAASRSISMSTDLNEYYDAFDDFDDEKTMTPDSMPSDEELDKRIREVIEEQPASGTAGDCLTSTYNINHENEQAGPSGEYEEEEEEGGEIEDDLESNCSALTADTVTDQYTSAADASEHHYHGVPHSMAMISQNSSNISSELVISLSFVYAANGT